MRCSMDTSFLAFYCNVMNDNSEINVMQRNLMSPLKVCRFPDNAKFNSHAPSSKSYCT
jgi:hypothetical protein